MEIIDLVTPERVIVGLRATSKKHALQQLAQRAAEATGLHERAVFDVLLERERLGTTGVGKGIAIPHGKLADIDGLYGFFVRLEKPVSFDSVDDEPVDIVFLLLAPESAGADHLKALARISRLLRDASTCKKIRGASDAGAIFDILTQDAHSQAA